MLHIVNNMTLSVDQSLSAWKPWLQGLRMIVGLLANADRRWRFIATCIRPVAAAAPYERKFRAGLPRIADWRWSIITKTLTPLLELQYPLVAFWNSLAFNGGDGEGNMAFVLVGAGAEHDDELDINKLSATIKSKFWWSYAAFLCQMHTACDRISSWAESCPCHSFSSSTGAAVANHLHQMDKSLARGAHSELNTRHQTYPMASERDPRVERNRRHIPERTCMAETLPERAHRAGDLSSEHSTHRTN